MKNFKQLSKLTFAGLLLLFISSCDDTSEIFNTTAPNAAVLAELNFAELELDATNPTNPALTLNWDKAEYGQQLAVNYSVEFSKDDAFTEPVLATTVTGKSTVTLSVNEVNAAAGNAGLNPFTWTTIYTRVVSSLGTQNGQKAVSNIVQLKVYPYYNYVFDDYFLVGNGLAPGWNNNNNNPALFRDEANKNVFYYTGFIQNSTSDYNEGRFKIIENTGEWQPQWGDLNSEGSDDPSTSGEIAGNPTTQAGDPGRFGVKTSGYYTFMIDFSTKKYTLNPFDASGITSPATLTVEGSSTASITMSSLAFDGHIWFAKNKRLIPGNLKFVTGAGANWGSSSSFSGVATSGGDAIPVIVEDDYDIWFNDLTGRYILIPLNL